MNRFDYECAADVAQAVSLAGKAMADTAASVGRARFLACGTNLVDLMKEDVEWPRTLIDVNHLPLRAIEELADGGLRPGALATNSETADHPVVRARYPVLSSAILSGATRQLRNAATNGGNLNQRTRCCYLYATATPCNKRAPGTGCGALGGFTRMHAILGASEHCVATNPSDMAVALAVLDAQVGVTGPQGERTIPLADYHRLPGDEPWRDNNRGAAELVTAVDLPAGDFSPHYTYLKLRDRPDGGGRPQARPGSAGAAGPGRRLGRPDGIRQVLTAARRIQSPQPVSWRRTRGCRHRQARARNPSVSRRRTGTRARSRSDD